MDFLNKDRGLILNTGQNLQQKNSRYFFLEFHYCKNTAAIFGVHINDLVKWWVGI